MSDYNSITHGFVASLIAAGARFLGSLAGSAAIVIVMALWLALLWCCRLFDRGHRAKRAAPLAGSR